MKILLLGCTENSSVCVALARLGLDTVCADENSALSEDLNDFSAVFLQSSEDVTNVPVK